MISIVAIWTVAEGKILETLENATYLAGSLELATQAGNANSPESGSRRPADGDPAGVPCAK
jgi:hypothetical protein